MTTSYTEQQGSPQESWTEDSFTATRNLLCAWEDRKTLVLELLGTAYPVLSGTGAICTACSTQPFPGINLGTGSTSLYDWAMVSATYQTGNIENLISESLEPTMEFRTLSHRDFRWASGTGDLLEPEEAPAKQEPGLLYRFTRHRASSVPTAALSLVGSVNVAAVTPATTGLSGLSFAAQTLLYLPPTLERVITTAGAGKWTINYSFQYKPNWDGATARGWNYFKRAKTGTWLQLYQVGSGSAFLLYPTGDFSAL